MQRSYISISAPNIATVSDNELFGQLASSFPFAVEQSQSAAWLYQIRHLRDLAARLPAAHFFVEFLIPRMGRRADLIIVHAGLIFVVEYTRHINDIAH